MSAKYNLRDIFLPLYLLIFIVFITSAALKEIEPKICL